MFNDVIGLGLLASETPKGPVSLRFPADALDMLFPKLFPRNVAFPSRLQSGQEKLSPRLVDSYYRRRKEAGAPGFAASEILPPH